MKRGKIDAYLDRPWRRNDYEESEHQQALALVLSAESYNSHLRPEFVQFLKKLRPNNKPLTLRGIHRQLNAMAVVQNQQVCCCKF